MVFSFQMIQTRRRGSGRFMQNILYFGGGLGGGAMRGVRGRTGGTQAEQSGGAMSHLSPGGGPWRKGFKSCFVKSCLKRPNYSTCCEQFAEEEEDPECWQRPHTHTASPMCVVAGPMLEAHMCD